MAKILHTARYTGTPWEILKSVVPEGFTVETLETLSSEQLIKQAADAEYLLVSGRLPIDESVLAAAPKLKMIQRTGVGTEMLDFDAIKRRGIPVYVNAGVNARSVAEHTLLLILSVLKNVPVISANVKRGVWKKQQTGVGCRELFGKTVGLVGMGAIGRQVAHYLKAFGAEVVYTDVIRQSEECESELGISFVPSFEELLPEVDILSFHCPLTKDNVKMLDGAAISKMKDGAAVVNTARGKLIDEEALYAALVAGKLSSAALDVHFEEPLKGDSKLATLDNVIMTPHIGGLSFEAFLDMMKGGVDNIVAFENGELDKLPKPLVC